MSQSTDRPPGEPAPETVIHEQGQWHRLHPLTPVLRSWKVIAVLLAVVAQRQGEGAIRDGLQAPTRLEALAWLGVLAVGGVVVGGYAFLAWQRSQYRVSTESLQLHTGIFFRQQRHARLDRLQAVDVVRPLLARLCGLAELRLEVAGGKGSGVVLSLLREDEAQQLRNTLLARAAGLTYEGEAAPQAPEHEVVAVPVDRTVESIVRSGWLMGSGAVLVAGVTAALIGNIVALGLMVPVLFGVGQGLWNRFSSGFGFRVATSPDGLRLHHGLMTSRSQTVPPGRVQAVQISQPLLWRGRDWWRVQVNIAGYSGGSAGGEDSGQGQTQENVLLPVGTREQALTVLSLVFPTMMMPTSGANSQEMVRLIIEGMTDSSGRRSLGPAVRSVGNQGFLTAPRVSRWLDPVGWCRHGVCVTEQVLLIRRGRWYRQLDVVPHARTQSLGVQQGPVQRWLAVATFVVHSTPGPVTPKAKHLANADAARLLAEQTARARAAIVDTGSADADHGPWLTGRG